MKKQHASAKDAKRGDAVRVGRPDSLLACKAAAKRASNSAKVPAGSAPSFVPADAQIKIARWPKL
jgi:hypothetical protein